VQARYPEGVRVHQTGEGYAHAQLDPEGAFPDVPFDQTRGEFVRLGTPTTGPPVVIVPTSRLPIYTPVPESLWPVLDRQYRLARTIDVDDPASPVRSVFDQQDAWFVPLSGFARFSRPGPAIRIYERNDSR
jgi:hypothetical protein